MIDPAALTQAFSALDECGVALDELEARCCEPSRSPRMKALAETLGEARGLIAGLTADADEDAVRTTLEDAGAQIGRLQVACCAPARIPLYATILEGLMTTQRAVDRAFGTGH